jgi:hypothetical protein
MTANDNRLLLLLLLLYSNILQDYVISLSTHTKIRERERDRENLENVKYVQFLHYIATIAIYAVFGVECVTASRFFCKGKGKVVPVLNSTEPR